MARAPVIEHDPIDFGSYPYSLEELLPVVRWHDSLLNFMRLRRDIVILSSTHIIGARAPVGWPMDDALFEKDPRHCLRERGSRFSHIVDIPLDCVAMVRASRSSLKDRFQRKRTAVRLRIECTDRTGHHNLTLPLTEAPLLLAALVKLLGARCDIDSEVTDELASRNAKRERQSEIRRQRAEELPYVAPKRRPIGGGILMLLGLGMLFAWYLAIKIENQTAFWLCVFIAAPIGACFLSLGRRLRLHIYDEIMDGERRDTIVYLRSFGSDDVRVPTPVPGFVGQMAERLLNQIPFVGLIFLAVQWLIRFCYFLIGMSGDRLEVQMARTLKPYGRMVAVGSPGESLAAAGAVRAYPRHDDWQRFVLDMLDRAQLVLLQIESTEGTWWEFGQCLRHVPRDKLVLLLTAKFGSQNRYDEMRLLASRAMDAELPRNMGDAALIYFDAAGKAHRAPMVWHHYLIAWLMPASPNVRKFLNPIILKLPKK